MKYMFGKDVVGLQNVVVQLGIQREAMNLPGMYYEGSSARDRAVMNAQAPSKAKVRKFSNVTKQQTTQKYITTEPKDVSTNPRSRKQA